MCDGHPQDSLCPSICIEPVECPGDCPNVALMLCCIGFCSVFLISGKEDTLALANSRIDSSNSWDNSCI